MADPVYGTLEEVERNVSALFPSGFLVTSQPSKADVTAQLGTFQAKVRQILRVKVGPALPAAASDAGRIASATVVAGTTAWALAVALQGRQSGPEQVRRWEKQYEDGLRTLREMPAELREEPSPQERVRFNEPARQARYSDDQLAGVEPVW